MSNPPIGFEDVPNRATAKSLWDAVNISDAEDHTAYRAIYVHGDSITMKFRGGTHSLDSDEQHKSLVIRDPDNMKHIKVICLFCPNDNGYARPKVSQSRPTIRRDRTIRSAIYIRYRCPRCFFSKTLNLQIPMAFKGAGVF
jgi:hypothetical protein